MEENKQKVLFKGLAEFNRPIIIDNSPIYGILYNSEDEKILDQKERGTIQEYVDYLVATEQFVKKGGVISDDGTVWSLPDEIHSFLNNASFKRIVVHLMKGEVGITKYEFNDFIDIQDNELDDVEPRLVINQSLIKRCENKYNNEVEK